MKETNDILKQASLAYSDDKLCAYLQTLDETSLDLLCTIARSHSDKLNAKTQTSAEDILIHACIDDIFYEAQAELMLRAWTSSAEMSDHLITLESGIRVPCA